MDMLLSPSAKTPKLFSLNLFSIGVVDQGNSGIRRKRETTPTITITITTKKKKKPSTPQSIPILSLPDDLVLNIVSRVPRLYYPTLSLVSKSFRSLLASPELYNVRSLLGSTESCLYVCFQGCPGFRWFTLCRKPDQTLTNDISETEKEKSSGYVSASVPISDSPNAKFASLVAVCSDIYNIGVPQSIGSICKESSSSVFILDCRSHTWRQAPSLPGKLFTVSVGVIDGKIYAAGIRIGVGNSVEVFDPKTQAWDPKPIPCSESLGFFYCKGACIDGKLHVTTHLKRVAYNFKEGRWDSSQQSMYSHMVSNSYCQIENVMYLSFHGVLTWYDTKAGKWRILQGLVGLPKLPGGACVRLANFGGKLAVLWEKIPCSNEPGSDLKWICCAEIALERRTSCGIWGKVEWFDHVLTVPRPYKLVNVLAATV